MIKSEFIRNLVKNVITKGSVDALGSFMRKIIMIGIMHFQDAWNMDLDRIQRCGIHYVTPDGKIRSFCTYNTIYRNDVEKKFAVPIKEWMKKTNKKIVDYA